MPSISYNRKPPDPRKRKPTTPPLDAQSCVMAPFRQSSRPGIDVPAAGRILQRRRGSISPDAPLEASHPAMIWDGPYFTRDQYGYYLVEHHSHRASISYCHESELSPITTSTPSGELPPSP